MIRKTRAGLATAAILAGWHLIWSALVWTGWGQSIYDFILWAHMIHLEITIGPFDILAASSLIALTAAIGFVAGVAGAAIWNATHRA